MGFTSFGVKADASEPEGLPDQPLQVLLDYRSAPGYPKIRARLVKGPPPAKCPPKPAVTPDSSPVKKRRTRKTNVDVKKAPSLRKPAQHSNSYVPYRIPSRQSASNAPRYPVACLIPSNRKLTLARNSSVRVRPLQNSQRPGSSQTLNAQSPTLQNKTLLDQAQKQVQQSLKSVYSNPRFGGSETVPLKPASKEGEQKDKTLSQNHEDSYDFPSNFQQADAVPPISNDLDLNSLTTTPLKTLHAMDSLNLMNFIGEDDLGILRSLGLLNDGENDMFDTVEEDVMEFGPYGVKPVSIATFEDYDLLRNSVIQDAPDSSSSETPVTADTQVDKTDPLKLNFIAGETKESEGKMQKNETFNDFLSKAVQSAKNRRNKKDPLGLNGLNAIAGDAKEPNKLIQVNDTSNTSLSKVPLAAETQVDKEDPLGLDAIYSKAQEHYEKMPTFEEAQQELLEDFTLPIEYTKKNSSIIIGKSNNFEIQVIRNAHPEKPPVALLDW